jgi:hypothetical protein
MRNNAVTTFTLDEADKAHKLGYAVRIFINGQGQHYFPCFTWEEKLKEAKRNSWRVFWSIDYDKHICFSCRHWQAMNHPETGIFQWLGGCPKRNAITSPNSSCEQFSRNGASPILAAAANAHVFKPKQKA